MGSRYEIERMVVFKPKCDMSVNPGFYAYLYNLNYYEG